MGNNNSKQNIIIALLIVNLFVVIIFGGSRMDDLNNSIYQINNNMNNLNSQISNVEYGVRNQLESMKEAELNYVTNFDYAYINLQAENKTMFTKFTIELREAKEDSSIYLVAKAEDGNVERSPLIVEKGLVYTGGMSLELTSNYTFNVEEEFNGNLKQLNYETYNIWLKDKFYDSRVKTQSSQSGSDNKSTYFSTRFDINTMGIEDFEIAEVRLEVWQYDEVIYSEDAGEGLFKLDDLSQEDLLKVTAGELIIDRPESFGSSTTTEEAVREEKKAKIDSEAQQIQGDATMTTSYVYQKVLIFEELDNYEEDGSGSRGLNERLVITFKDGSEFEIR